MRSFGSIISYISRGFLWPCSVMLVVLTILVLVGVISRYVFNAPIKWVPETVQFLFAAIWLLCGAALIATGEHITIDLLVNRFSRRVQAVIDCVNSLSLWGFLGVLLYYSAERAWNSLKAGETAGTFWDPPLWPIKITIAFGVFLMLLQGAVKFIGDFYYATKGRSIEGKGIEK